MATTSVRELDGEDQQKRPPVNFDFPGVVQLLEHATTQSGKSLVSLVDASPVLLVFLRHAGCTFCREALGDIAGTRSEIERDDVNIVLVHMGDTEAMQAVIGRYGLSDLERICDKDQQLYDAFGLKKGNFIQLYGLKVWFRGLIAGLFRGHGFAMPQADATQMPGVFYISQGWVIRRFRHRSAADRPRYTALTAEPKKRGPA